MAVIQHNDFGNCLVPLLQLLTRWPLFVADNQMKVSSRIYEMVQVFANIKENNQD